MTRVDPEHVDALLGYFRPIADMPPDERAIEDSFQAFMKYGEQADRELAGRVIARPDTLDDEDACLVVRMLVDSAYRLRALAYVTASSQVQDQVPGGFCVRMFCNDLSPEADALDLLAIALANAVPDMSFGKRFRLCI